MAMGFGDYSLLLPMHATSRIHCSSATVNAVPRLQRTVILAAVPRNGSPKRRVLGIQAAESRSVDAPESSASTNGTTGSPQAPSHLDLLQRMTEKSTASQGAQVKTIRDQLESQGEPEEAVVSLAKSESKDKAGVPELTISQRRNIRRQDYLNKVSERNDAPFFASVAAIVLVPPILILAFAVATGYVELFP